MSVGNVTIRGLVINRFRRNVVLSYYNYLEGCFVGTDATGTMARSRNVADGVDAQYSTIGGLLPSQRNVISGNNGAGISAIGGDIQGNFIGIDATGMVALPNSINVDTNSATIRGSGHAGRSATRQRHLGKLVVWHSARPAAVELSGADPWQPHRDQRRRYRGNTQWKPWHSHFERLPDAARLRWPFRIRRRWG